MAAIIILSFFGLAVLFGIIGEVRDYRRKKQVERNYSDYKNKTKS